MKVALPYGKSTLTVDVPDENLMKIGLTSELRVVKNARAEITKNLRKPIGTPPLSSLVGRGKRVAVIVDDYTRPCPDNILLPVILEELSRTGVRKEDIKIISATGLHPPHPDKLEEVVGREVLEEYDVVYHDAEEPEMTSFGRTSRGISVKVNRLVGEADFKMSTGLIEPHFFAGFSGGRKSIMPGASAKESIFGNHGYRMIDDPRARAGILEGNPVHEDALEHANRAGLNFIVNVILNRDKRIGKIVAGEPTKAHEIGVEVDRKIVGVRFERKADVTITTNSGYPLDLDLYQTVKGIDTASTITRNGGCIIVASECSNGIGPEKFRKTHSEARSPDEVLSNIREEGPFEAQWQNQILARVQKDHKIYLVSSLQNRVVEEFMIEPADSVESALDEALREAGRTAKIAVLPEGPAALPMLVES